ncbi:MAG: OsmC family protein [Thermodesulfovibrionales bacterium]|nr:OsmC family protein [Thermodesulfovibrionales bacterium]
MEETEGLEESLAGYKEKIPLINKGTLTLDRDLIFVARTQRGYEFEYDPKFEWGCSPTETLLMSLAGCLAIDMVSFLRKMKAEITAYKMDVSGQRNPDPPQYYKSIEMVLNITGKGITPKKVERAIALSQEKYCSVHHTLRKDLKVDIKYDIISED